MSKRKKALFYNSDNEDSGNNSPAASSSSSITHPFSTSASSSSPILHSLSSDTSSENSGRAEKLARKGHDMAMRMKQNQVKFELMLESYDVIETNNRTWHSENKIATEINNLFDRSQAYPAQGAFKDQLQMIRSGNFQIATVIASHSENTNGFQEQDAETKAMGAYTYNMQSLDRVSFLQLLPTQEEWSMFRAFHAQQSNADQASWCGAILRAAPFLKAIFPNDLLKLVASYEAASANSSEWVYANPQHPLLLEAADDQEAEETADDTEIEVAGDTSSATSDSDLPQA